MFYVNKIQHRVNLVAMEVMEVIIYIFITVSISIKNPVIKMGL